MAERSAGGHRNGQHRGGGRVVGLVTGVLVLGAGMLLGAVPASAVTAPVGEVYVAAGGVAQYGTSSTGVARALPYPDAPGSSGVSHVVVSASGKFAYALDCTTGGIEQYAVDTAGLLIGSLVPMSPGSVAVPGGCRSNTQFFDVGHQLVENKAGTFLFVVGSAAGSFTPITLASYKVATTGALTLAFSLRLAGSFNDSIAVTPNGKFLYWADAGDGGGSSVTEFTVSTSGALALKHTYTYTTDLGIEVAQDVAVNGLGNALYVADEVRGLVPFAINTTTGALTARAQQPADRDAAYNGVAVTPNSKFVYALGEGGIDIYKATTSGAQVGALTMVGGIGTSDNEFTGAVAPSGKWLYIANPDFNTIGEYAINATTGNLTSIGTIATPAEPFGIAVRA